jgi:hypothetical protein
MDVENEMDDEALMKEALEEAETRAAEPQGPPSPGPEAGLRPQDQISHSASVPYLKRTVTIKEASTAQQVGRFTHAVLDHDESSMERFLDVSLLERT